MDEQNALSDVRGSTTHLVPHTVIPVDKLPLHMRSSSAMSLSTRDTAMQHSHSSIAPKTIESPSGNVPASAPTMSVKEKEQIVPHTVIPLEKLHHNRQDSVGSLPDKEKELNTSASSPNLKAGLRRQLSRRMLQNPLKELEQSSKYATMLIIVLEIQFFLDAMISATFIALEAVPTLMLLDAMNFADNIVSDSSFLFRWLQVGGSFLSFFCSIVCLVYILRPYHPRNLRPIFLFLISVKLGCFLVDITNFTYPTSQRIALAATLIFIHLSTVITLVIMFFRTPTFYLKPSERGHVDSKKTLIKLFEKNDGKASEKALEGLRRVERTLAIERVRKRHKKRLLGGAKYLGWVTAIFLVLLSINWIVEFNTTVSTLTGREYFETKDVNEMRKKALEHSPLYQSSRCTVSKRAAIVLVDGLDRTQLTQNENLKSFWTDIAQDSVRYSEMAVQLPTMSVPNWMATITGSSPEFTGVLGNLQVPETIYDTIFSQVKRCNGTTFITSSPWFLALAQSKIDYDKTVPFEYDLFANTRPSAEVPDALRFNHFLSAVKNKSADFMLLHLSNVDLQGHTGGIDAEYTKAVDKSVTYLRQVVDAVDNSTLLVILSDHGMRRVVGGHGGAQDEIRFVPLAYYRKNSNAGVNLPTQNPFKSAEKTYPNAKLNIVSNLDVAATVSAYMGLPAPSAAIGKFDPFLSLLLSPTQLSNSYRDLYVQKLSLVGTYFRTAGFQISEIPWLQDMEQAYNAILSDEEYALRTVQLIEAFYAKRTALGSQQMLRNILTLFALSAFWIVLTLLIVHKYTYCDLWVILRRPKQIDDRDKGKNRLAFIICFAFTIFYYAFSWGAYTLIYYIIGYTYEYLDSTVLHLPSLIFIYIGASLIPGFLLWYTYQRLYLFKCLTPLPRSAPYSTIIRRWFFTHKREIQDSLFLYLMRHYNVLFTSIAMMVLIVMSGFYTYLVPIFWNVNYIEPETWSLRFRLLTVQFMSFPLFFGNLYLLWSQPKYHFTNSIYDDIYKCEIAKEKRRLAVVTDESEKAKGLRDLFEEELLFESVKFDKETKILADLVKVD